jgi:coproporphyrinogen III oxidase
MTSDVGDETAGLATRQAAARGWFEDLQSQLVAAFERMEDLGPGRRGSHDAPGRFVRKPWSRTDHTGAPGGGGSMAVLKGRVFEKAGIHSSTVFGTFAPEFAAQIPGASEDPRFWASGVSLIAHPWNPNLPAVHMNTRFVVTSKAWFGGGADLTPVLDARRHQTDPDALAFHAAMKAACDAHAAVAPYERFKAWCEDYFFVKHRNEPRGIGGIFFDYLDGADGFAPHFAFTRTVGNAFLDVYPRIVAANAGKPFTAEQEHEQLVRRGRYVEFNLLYDRGTIFGLRTGGNVESILSSLPPRVEWP